MKHEIRISDRHRRAARAIEHALVADSPEAWQMMVPVLGTRLTPPECASLAWASMTAAHPQDAALVAHAVLGEAGPPMTAFAAIWPEARAWASEASNAERRAYAAAAVQRMPASTRAAFVTWAKGAGHA
jgi:hypothetical protein